MKSSLLLFLCLLLCLLSCCLDTEARGLLRRRSSSIVYRPLPQVEKETTQDTTITVTARSHSLVTNGTTIPLPYASFVGKDKNGTISYSAFNSINSTIGGNVTNFFNSTIPGFLPSAVTVDSVTGTIYRLGTNVTNLCDNEATNYVEINNGTTISYIALNGDSDAAHANQYMDVFYNSRVGLLYASVYNTAPNCSYGNLTSAIITIDPTTGISKVEVDFPVNLLITSPGRTVFDFSTLFAYAIFNDYTNETSDGAPVLYAIDLQGLKAITVACPTISNIYQIAFNTLTSSIVYLGNSTLGPYLTIGRMTVSEDGNSAVMNETVPLKWLPETCAGLGYHRAAFDPKSGYYALVCGGLKAEDFPTQVVTFNIRGGNHYSAFIKYPIISGYNANIAANLVYLPPY